MIRFSRALPLALIAVVPLLLTGCGAEQAGPAQAAASPKTEASHSKTEVSRELGARARALGIAPELVYVTEAPGFTLAQQSVGVFRGDGFSATYVSRQGGRQIRLSVDRGSLSAAGCDAPAQPACQRDGELEDAWYRAAEDGQQVYLLSKDGHVVRLAADAGVPREVLRKAARDTHRPTEDEEATELLPPAQGGAEQPGSPASPTTPVEPGDLPSTGDGAPRNDVNAGG
ncbi:membrane protein [Streptomyces thermocarboxydovorans]|uniref:Membrane protein n=1 Tax=Streptomyces thermocarboxydovorans TaxID=59298 RepID=A0ABP3SNQ9_9ACTN